jgi:hypothetical protein
MQQGDQHTASACLEWVGSGGTSSRGGTFHGASTSKPPQRRTLRPCRNPPASLRAAMRLRNAATALMRHSRATEAVRRSRSSLCRRSMKPSMAVTSWSWPSRHSRAATRGKPDMT